MQTCFDLKSCSLGQLVKKNVFLVIITIIDDSKTHLFQKLIYFKKLSFQKVIYFKSSFFTSIIIKRYEQAQVVQNKFA